MADCNHLHLQLRYAFITFLSWCSANFLAESPLYALRRFSFVSFSSSLRLQPQRGLCFTSVATEYRHNATPSVWQIERFIKPTIAIPLDNNLLANSSASAHESLSVITSYQSRCKHSVHNFLWVILHKEYLPQPVYKLQPTLNLKFDASPNLNKGYWHWYYAYLLCVLIGRTLTMKKEIIYD